MSLEGRINCLITGGSGFLGSNIVKAVRQEHPEWFITVLDLNAPPKELADLFDEYRYADVTSSESVNNAFKGLSPDVVVHAAGVVPARSERYSKNIKQWNKVRSINYQGTVHILDATLAAGCTKFVYTSSNTTVIDDLAHDYYNVNESTPLGLAKLHYGKSKALAEQYVLASRHAENGLKACALRPCTIIGPGDIAVISLIHDLIGKLETYFVVGNGDNLFDYMYIDNAVQAHVLAIENVLTTQTAAGHAMFISNQEPVYFWDFFLAIWAQFGHTPRFRIFLPMWFAWIVAFVLEVITYFTGADSTLDTGSVNDAVGTRYADNSKAIQILGYKPKVGLAEGLKRSCDAYKDHLSANKAKVLTAP